MTAVEVILILIGLILMIGSFFVTEKLSQKEISQISELSSVELRRILEKNMGNARQKVENLVDDLIDESMEIANRAMEKKTNEKIQDISEYSETVIDSIDKNHSEVMFLYSMLNEKHTELTEMAKNLERLKRELLNLQNNVNDTVQESVEMVQKITENISCPQNLEVDNVIEEEEKEEEELLNHNQSILELYHQDIGVTDIARQLGLGVGEVKLVIDLYREDEI